MNLYIVLMRSWDGGFRVEAIFETQELAEKRGRELGNESKVVMLEAVLFKL
jgi:hypothetical protein